MSVEVAWLNEAKTAITYIFDCHWDWAEFVQQDRRADELMSSVDYKVDLIIDFSTNSYYPPNVFSNFMRAVKEKHPNRNRIILVGSEAVFKTMADTFLRIAPEGMFVVKTLEEARQLVGVHDGDIL